MTAPDTDHGRPNGRFPKKPPHAVRPLRRAWAVFFWWCGGFTALSGMQHVAMDGAALRAHGAMRYPAAWGQLIPFGQGFLTVAHLLWFGRASPRAGLLIWLAPYLVAASLGAAVYAAG